MTADYDYAEPVEVAIGAAVVIVAVGLVLFVVWRLARRVAS